jgi:hypothetical protein
MALQRIIAKRNGTAAKIIEMVLLGTSAVLAAMVLVPANQYGAYPWLVQILEKAQKWALFIIPISSVAAVFAKWYAGYLGSTRVWEEIHAILDEFQKTALPHSSAKHRHRVTLFKHVTWTFKIKALLQIFQGRYPWQGWLIPVDRSGDTSQNPDSLFFAPKNSPDHAMGFAGKVWKERSCQYISNLPEVTRSFAEKKAHKELGLYCEQSYSDKWEIKKRILSGKAYARSFWGFAIELSDGTLWGVVVIDSVDSALLGQEEIKEIYMKKTAAVLGVLLKVV